MNKAFTVFLSITAMLLSTACSKDHDDPELNPIDTTKIKITAKIVTQPSNSWLVPTQELRISVSNIEMTAPKGVVLRNINLMKDNQVVIQKPYSGENLEFILPVSNIRPGRINFAIWGDLIQKDHRDANIIIADNIQRNIFSEVPKFECEVLVDITVRSQSTSGEELNHTFQVTSTNESPIKVPASELYWTPESGTASNLEVTLDASAKSYSTNTTLESVVDIAYWERYEGKSSITLTIPNTRGSLTKELLNFCVNTDQFGTWENITIDPMYQSYTFSVIETN